MDENLRTSQTKNGKINKLPHIPQSPAHSTSSRALNKLPPSPLINIPPTTPYVQVDYDFFTTFSTLFHDFWDHFGVILGSLLGSLWDHYLIAA